MQAVRRTRSKARVNSRAKAGEWATCSIGKWSQTSDARHDAKWDVDPLVAYEVIPVRVRSQRMMKNHEGMTDGVSYRR